MNKDKFWDIIETTLDAYDGNLESYVSVLQEELEKESLEDIIKWQEIFNAYLEISDKEKLWGASYLINDSLSNDSFEYFKAWLISLGEEIFVAALEEPDRLGVLLQDVEDPDDFLAEFEDIMYVALDAYAEKSELDPEEAEEAFNEKLEGLSEADKQLLLVDINYPEDVDEKWNPEDDETLEGFFPNIYQKFIG